MLLRKITQLVHCSVLKLPNVLETIVLDYYGDFYEVELVYYVGEMTQELIHEWNRPIPVLREDSEEEEIKSSRATSATSSTNTPASAALYERLQESITSAPPDLAAGLSMWGGFWAGQQAGPRGPMGAVGQRGAVGYDGRRPIVVLAEDAQLLFSYHPQLKPALLYYKPLDFFLIPYNYSKWEFLAEFFLKFNMFVAIPDLRKVSYGKWRFKIAIPLV